MPKSRTLKYLKEQKISEVKKMTEKEAFKDYFKLYLLTLAVALIFIVLGTLIYASWKAKPFMETLRWGFIIEALVLLGVGVVSMLPLSEYRYILGAGLNPVIAREGMKHLETGGEPKRMGIILGIVGLTLLLIYLILFP